MRIAVLPVGVGMFFRALRSVDSTCPRCGRTGRFVAPARPTLAVVVLPSLVAAVGVGFASRFVDWNQIGHKQLWLLVASSAPVCVAALCSTRWWRLEEVRP